jgi:hypothetical protein
MTFEMAICDGWVVAFDPWWGMVRYNGSRTFELFTEREPGVWALVATRTSDERKLLHESKAYAKAWLDELYSEQAEQAA